MVGLDEGSKSTWKSAGSIVIASLITLYFFRKNLIGIHESSDKALKIMIATTIMAVVIFGWCGETLLIQGPAPVKPVEEIKAAGGSVADSPRNELTAKPDLNPHRNYTTEKDEDPLGFMSGLFPRWPSNCEH